MVSYKSAQIFLANTYSASIRQSFPPPEFCTIWHVIVILSVCHCYHLGMSLLPCLSIIVSNPLSMSLLPCLSIIVSNPLGMSLLPSLYVIVMYTLLPYQYALVVIGYSVVILLISDWLKNTSEDEHVSLVMWSFSLR